MNNFKPGDVVVIASPDSSRLVSGSSWELVKKNQNGDWLANDMRNCAGIRFSERQKIIGQECLNFKHKHAQVN